jgi:hypothetical protein
MPDLKDLARAVEDVVRPADLDGILRRGRRRRARNAIATAGAAVVVVAVVLALPGIGLRDLASGPAADPPDALPVLSTGLQVLPAAPEGANRGTAVAVEALFRDSGRLYALVTAGSCDVWSWATLGSGGTPPSIGVRTVVRPGTEVCDDAGNPRAVELPAAAAAAQLRDSFSAEVLQVPAPDAGVMLPDQIIVLTTRPADIGLERQAITELRRVAGVLYAIVTARTCDVWASARVLTGPRPVVAIAVGSLPQSACTVPAVARAVVLPDDQIGTARTITEGMTGRTLTVPPR